MNIHVKIFLHRGLLFAGFGPVVMGIVLFILSKTGVAPSFSGGEILVGILSTYILAFVHAGASVFYQIDRWPPLRSLLTHSLTLWAVYVGCYFLNNWIPRSLPAVLWFTLLFFMTYLVVYLAVYISLAASARRLNEKIKS